jgi:hypothetical protein
MIYEVRTYGLKPGAVPGFEENFAKALPHREKYSKLGAFWHTEFGPLNQVIQVWPYENLEERTRIRAEVDKDPNWPPKNDRDIYVNTESEIFTPAPFMRPLGGDQALGNIYEMRIYSYKTEAMGEVIKRWAAAVPHREEYSPLAAGMYTELGDLTNWVHIWPYKDMEEREKVRAESRKNPNWPPSTVGFLVREENKLLVPASFSPMH